MYIYPDQKDYRKILLNINPCNVTSPAQQCPSQCTGCMCACRCSCSV